LPIEDPIGNWQSQIGNVSTNSISPRRGFVPATPTRESKSGTNEICADKRAGGRTFYNGCTPGTKTSACDSLSRLMISLPYHHIFDFRFQILDSADPLYSGLLANQKSKIPNQKSKIHLTA
jgi:hypothetical protein